jgi:hypothetical protein
LGLYTRDDESSSGTEGPRKRPIIQELGALGHVYPLVQQALVLCTYHKNARFVGTTFRKGQHFVSLQQPAEHGVSYILVRITAIQRRRCE